MGIVGEACLLWGEGRKKLERGGFAREFQGTFVWEGEGRLKIWDYGLILCSVVNVGLVIVLLGNYISN